MKVEYLIKEINTVFPLVDKPSDAQLTFHETGCHECDYLVQDLSQFKDKTLPNNGIREIHQEMSCLSAKAWRWALPSYLNYCLSEDGAYSQMETEFLIYNLSPSEEFSEDAKVRLSALNKEQVQCLVNFLEWCKVHDYWREYCPDEIKSGIIFLSETYA